MYIWRKKNLYYKIWVETISPPLIYLENIFHGSFIWFQLDKCNERADYNMYVHALRAVIFFFFFYELMFDH